MQDIDRGEYGKRERKITAIGIDGKQLSETTITVCSSPGSSIRPVFPPSGCCRHQPGRIAASMARPASEAGLPRKPPLKERPDHRPPTTDQ